MLCGLIFAVPRLSYHRDMSKPRISFCHSRVLTLTKRSMGGCRCAWHRTMASWTCSTFFSATGHTWMSVLDTVTIFRVTNTHSSYRYKHFDVICSSFLQLSYSNIDSVLIKTWYSQTIFVLKLAWLGNCIGVVKLYQKIEENFCDKKFSLHGVKFCSQLFQLKFY